MRQILLRVPSFRQSLTPAVTSHRRRYDAITTLCVCLELLTFKGKSVIKSGDKMKRAGRSFLIFVLRTSYQKITLEDDFSFFLSFFLSAREGVLCYW